MNIYAFRRFLRISGSLKKNYAFRTMRTIRSKQTEEERDKSNRILYHYRSVTYFYRPTTLPMEMLPMTEAEAAAMRRSRKGEELSLGSLAAATVASHSFLKLAEHCALSWRFV